MPEKILNKPVGTAKETTSLNDGIQHSESTWRVEPRPGTPVFMFGGVAFTPKQTEAIANKTIYDK